MDSDDAYTPRVGRKKKSTLSKLAARGRRQAEEVTEAGSSSIIPNGSVTRDSMPKYPIDANVEITASTNVIDDDDDSDEGIEVANDTTSSLERGTNSGSRGAANTNKRLSRNSQADSISYREQQQTDANHNTSKTELPHIKSDRLPMLCVTGDDALKTSPKAGSSLMPLQTTMFSSEELQEDSKLNPVRLSTLGSCSDMENDKSTGRNYLTGFKQGLSSANSSCLPAKSIHTSGSRSDENLARYRESLHEQIMEDDNIEKKESTDTISALRYGSSKIMTHQSTSQSLVSSQDRPWASQSKSGGAYDTISQRSFMSTSGLPLITTKQARKRSFLVGSSGHTPLMGIEEMERFFPDHKMRVFCGIWNMSDLKLLPESLDDWLLPDTCDYIQDLYVIGTQESCPNRKEWEILLQETLGPSHVLFHTGVHGVLYLCIFLRRDLIWFCSVPEESIVTTRMGPSNIATKGAIAVCFTFFGTSFLFVNTHFTPHDGKVKDRIADYHKIITSLTLPTIVVAQPYATQHDDVTARFDSVFWMGDLNFRLEKDRMRVDSAMSGLDTQDAPSYEDLMRHDELFRVRNEGLAFQDFQEGRIKFKPTYKFDKGTDNYDTSKKLRIPSYTDRILFRNRKKSNISCLYYDSVNSINDSDHKPVYAMFEVLLRPGKDNIPLAAGQFNREVWLEGNRRRTARLVLHKPRPRSSSVCSLQ